MSFRCFPQLRIFKVMHANLRHAHDFNNQQSPRGAGSCPHQQSTIRGFPLIYLPVGRFDEASPHSLTPEQRKAAMETYLQTKLTGLGAEPRIFDRCRACSTMEVSE
jgi:hypothetical protein